MVLDIKIIFLGTSDSIPSAERNHSAFLLNYKDEGILVDCGEGTQRQLRKAGINPCIITKLLITHWHGDHVLGIPGLLQTLAFSDYNKKLQIYGPKGTKNFIKEMLNVFVFVNKINLEVHETYKEGKFFENQDFFIESKRMIHGIPCNAYCFIEKEKLRIDKEKLKKHKISEGAYLRELKNGKNIKYQGKTYSFKDLTYKTEGRKVCFVLDTNKNDKIVPFVKDADLLVIESNFDSSMEKRAKEYHHMTSQQCAEIAKKAKVKKLILTHISNRYNKDFSVLLKEATKFFKNSELAKDLMEVKL
ncbi:MAG: ribonuclease Z [Nanoarchaeota archaeon]